MDATSHNKSVRWAYDDSFVSASSAGSIISSPDISSSTIAFISAQLIAHGFARSPGLQLEGLAHNEQEAAAKCLLQMLSQRVDDLSRSEELTTKLRTLTYDYQRLQSMHTAAKDETANAERDMEAAKSKMNAALKSLTATEQLQKQTAANLSRTQTALQYNKSTAQNEIKRKEKEVEKVMERWGKICNEQARLGSVGSGLACANFAMDSSVHGPREHEVIEQALKESEVARIRMQEENEALRDVILASARSLQALLQSFEAPTSELQSLITPTQLFGHNGSPSLYNPSANSLNAHLKLRELSGSVQTKIEAMVDERDTKRAQTAPLESSTRIDNSLLPELKQLRSQVASLQAQLAQKSASDDQTATQTKAAAEEVQEASKRVQSREKALKQEKDILAEASSKLEQERAEFEAAQLRFAEEQREWRFQQMLSRIPDTPEPSRGREAEDPSLSQTGDGDRRHSRSGRVHRVRRTSRASIGSQSQEILEPNGQDLHVSSGTAAQPQEKKSKTVAFAEEQVFSGIPPDDSWEPSPETVMSFEVNEEGVDTDDKPPNQITPPQSSTNPFDEVILRSAQRSRPLFSEGAALEEIPLPEVPALSLSSAASGSAPVATTEPHDINPFSSNSRIPRSPTKQKPSSSKSRSKASPGKPRRGEKGEPVTPPIFTHRRIVGKKHQYAPANPSPLSKVVKWTEDVSIESVGEADFSSANTDRKSFDSSGGEAGSPNRGGLFAAELPVVTEDDEEWQPIEEEKDDIAKGPPVTELHPPSKNSASISISSSRTREPPREWSPPLTEKDLTLKPRRPAIPSSSSARSSSSKTKIGSTSALSSRSKSAKPTRHAKGTVSNEASKGKEKEKENIANTVPAKTAISRPVAAGDKDKDKTAPRPVRPIPRKVIMGVSTAKTSGSGGGSSAPTGGSPTKAKHGASRRLRPPPAVGPGAKRS